MTSTPPVTTAATSTATSIAQSVSFKLADRRIHRRHGLTIVLKIGTSSICDPITHYPLLANLSSVVETIIALRQLGHRVVLVTSGAIGVGLRCLNIAQKPKEVIKNQVYILSIILLYNIILIDNITRLLPL
jgi:hypothetical protein